MKPLVRWVVLMVLLGLPALAQGLVLPFAGPGGQSLAQSLANGLGAPPPSLSAILLPNLPWNGSYESAAGGLETPGGAVLAREVAAAPWLLVGKVDDQNWIELYLAWPGRLERARVSRPDLALVWVSQALQQARRPYQLAAQSEELLTRLAAGDLDNIDQGPVSVALYNQAIALIDGGQRPPNDRLAQLYPQLMNFWLSALGGQLPLAYRALIDYNDPATRPQALAAARELAQGQAYERLTAILMLRDAGDASWREVARRVARQAPQVAIAWEDLSFAALDDNNPKEAVEALLQARRLRPDSGLYHINLGWSYYLLGNPTRSTASSLRGIALDESPVPAYNLGLVRALAGDIRGAREAYNLALERDNRNEVDAALKDLVDTQDPAMLYWQGYLKEKTGDLLGAREAYQGFINAFPESILLPAARKGLQARVETRLNLRNVSLVPAGPDARPFSSGETAFVQLEIEGLPFVPKSKLTTTLLNEAGQVVQTASKDVRGGATLAALVETSPGVTFPQPGKYRLEIRFADSVVSLQLEVGAASLARQLATLGLQVRGLGGAPLISERELLGAQGEQKLLERIVAELQATAPRAEAIAQLNRPLASGPYQGKSVVQWMAAATPELVSAFLRAVLEAPELLGDADVVNAFVDWLLGLP